MTTEQALRGALNHFGFATAARELKMRDVENPQAMLALWQNYPACLNRFPTVLRKKRTWVDKRGQ